VQDHKERDGAAGFDEDEAPAAPVALVAGGAWTALAGNLGKRSSTQTGQRS